jgi:hypothetical protein
MSIGRASFRVGRMVRCAASGGLINRGLNFELNAEKNLPGAFTRD